LQQPWLYGSNKSIYFRGRRDTINIIVLDRGVCDMAERIESGKGMPLQVLSAI
jgi:hypothetical protein